MTTARMGVSLAEGAGRREPLRRPPPAGRGFDPLGPRGPHPGALTGPPSIGCDRLANQPAGTPMLFPTAAFAVFFVAAFTASWLLRPHFLVWRAATGGFRLFFLGYVDVPFPVRLVASATMNWAFGLGIRWARPDGERTVSSRRLVALAVVANLVVLGVFRYHGFFVSSTADTLAAFGLHPTPPVLDILLPIGISFFTFHAISYVVDVGRGDLQPSAYGAP